MSATLFRFHRGGLAESMKTCVPVTTMDELLVVLRTQATHPCDVKPRPDNIEVKPYSFDSRILWDTHIVKVSGIPVGFTDGPIDA